MVALEDEVQVGVESVFFLRGCLLGDLVQPLLGQYHLCQGVDGLRHLMDVGRVLTQRRARVLDVHLMDDGVDVVVGIRFR
jgi:hypothetical protein